MPADTRRAQLRAAELLFAQPRLSFYDLAHLDVRRLELPINVIFDSVDSYCASTGIEREELAHGRALEGMTVRVKGGYLILYNERAIARRRNWTVAHELGHVMLDHSFGNTDEEDEADAFAAALLAPLPALRYLEVLRGEPLDLDAVCGNFNLSRKAAGRRLSELSEPRRNLSQIETALMMKLFGAIGDPSSLK